MTIKHQNGGYAGAGLILTRVEGHAIRFLLLRGTDSGIWSFSKGHPESCDGGRPLCTAVRETLEETGLVNEWDYAIFGNSIRFGKRPYWIAVVRPGACLRMNPREHDMAGWFTLDEVCQLNTNADVRAWTKRTGPDTAFQALISSVVCSAIGSTRWTAGEYNAS